MNAYYSILSIKARTLNVTTPTYITKYNGSLQQCQEEIIKSEFSIPEGTGLLPGHTFEYTYLGRTDVGVYSNLISYSIVNENNEDVSSYYSVSITYGDLVIVEDLQISLSSSYVGAGLYPNVIKTNSNNTYYEFEFEILTYYILDSNGIKYDSMDEITEAGNYKVVVEAYSFRYDNNEINLKDLEPQNNFNEDGYLVLDLLVKNF